MEKECQVTSYNYTFFYEMQWETEAVKSLIVSCRFFGK